MPPNDPNPAHSSPAPDPSRGRSNEDIEAASADGAGSATEAGHSGHVALPFPRRLPRQPAHSRWIGWLVLTLIVLMALLQQIPAGGSRSAPTANDLGNPQQIFAPEPLDPVLLSSKLVVAALESHDATPGSQSLIVRFVLDPLRKHDKLAPADALRLAIVLAVSADAAEGTRAVDELAAGPTGPVQRDALLVQRVLAQGPVTLVESEWAGFESRHGWFAQLLRTHGTATGPSDRAALAQSGVIALAVLSVALILGLAAFIVGTGLLIAAALLRFQGRLKRRYKQCKAPASVYAETVAVFLATLLLVWLIVGSVGDELPFFARVALQLSTVIVCLWPLARQVPLDLLARDYGWKSGRGLLNELVAGIVGYLAGLPIVAVGMALTSLLLSYGPLSGGSPMGEPQGPSHPIIESYRSPNWWDIVAIYVLGVIWAPFVEETIFRGALYAYLRTTRVALVSALLTGVAFAVIHPQGLAFVPALASLGFVFALIREWRGSLIGPMVAHALHNATILTIGILVFRTLGVS